MEKNDGVVEKIDDIAYEVRSSYLNSGGRMPTRKIKKLRDYLNDVLQKHCRRAAKDAEIAQLKKSVEKWMEYHETAKGERDACLDELKKRDAEIASLRSLVGGLADVAERFVSCKATECETVCGIGAKCIHKKAVELIRKAREAVK